MIRHHHMILYLYHRIVGRNAGRQLLFHHPARFVQFHVGRLRTAISSIDITYHSTQCLSIDHIHLDSDMISSWQAISLMLAPPVHAMIVILHISCKGTHFFPEIAPAYTFLPYKNWYAANAADFSHGRRRYQQRPLLIKDTAAADSREIVSLPAQTSFTPCMRVTFPLQVTSKQPQGNIPFHDDVIVQKESLPMDDSDSFCFF